eukprot:1292902-Prymnesium_polylepis.1
MVRHDCTEPDPDGRLVRRPESRPSADLRLFATKPQISTCLRLDQVPPRTSEPRVHQSVNTALDVQSGMER